MKTLICTLALGLSSLLLTGCDYWILRAGQTSSVDGVSLAMQTDGNLVIYRQRGAQTVSLWASNTSGHSCSPNTCFMTFQTDGNLVLYENNKPYWSSNTSGHDGAQLMLSSTAPFMTIVNTAGNVIWAANTQLNWLTPLKSKESDYMQLFTNDSTWANARGQIEVFKLYAGDLDTSSDDDLRTIFAYLNSHHIALAVEAGMLSSVSNGCGVSPVFQEGYVPGLQEMADHVKRLGGVWAYVSIDESFGNGIYNPKGCMQSAADAAANVAQNFKIVQAVFPKVMLGDTENVNPTSVDNFMSNYQQWITTLEADTGTPLAYFHHDVDWSSASWAAGVGRFQTLLAQNNIPYGVIRNGTAGMASDAAWIQSAENNMNAYNSSGLQSPSQNVFQTWDAYPSTVANENGQTLTHLILVHAGLAQ